MTIGLDLGSRLFRSLRSTGEGLFSRSCPAFFIALPDTAGHRRLLVQSKTQFATCSEQLLVFGHAAVEWSTMLNLTLSPLLRGGRIPTSDPVSRQVLTLMIDAVLPNPTQPGTICCMTVPHGGQSERSQNNDTEFFQQVVALRGYQPQPITATHALALAELNDSSFTGIAVTLGHTSCEFGISLCGREIARCTVMQGLENFEGAPLLGERIDSQDPTATRVNVDDEYARFLADVVREARKQFEFDRTIKTLPQPLAVVCAGGITASDPFLPMFQHIWHESHWPVSTRPIRIVKDGNLAIARGCLIQAELDRHSRFTRVA